MVVVKPTELINMNDSLLCLQKNHWNKWTWAALRSTLKHRYWHCRDSERPSHLTGPEKQQLYCSPICKQNI